MPSSGPLATTGIVAAGPMPASFLGNACSHAPRASHIAVIINSTFALWNCALMLLAVDAGLVGGTRSASLRPRALKDFFTVFLLFAVFFGPVAIAAAGMPCTWSVPARFHLGRIWPLGVSPSRARAVVYSAGRAPSCAGLEAGALRH